MTIYFASPLTIQNLDFKIQNYKKMSISKTRSILYKAARILGDIDAVKKGTVGKRIVRRAAGKATGRLLRKLK